MNTHGPQNQRRKNDRFPLRAHATLKSGLGDWPAHVINFSLEGAMIAIAEEHSIQLKDEVELEVFLDENQPLQLVGQVAHIKEHYIGMRCKTLTTEDEQLLKQLIEKIGEN